MSATVSLQQLTNQLADLESESLQTIDAAATEADLEALRISLLGKKGRLSAVLGSMGRLGPQERPQVGQRANDLKERVQAQLAARMDWLKSSAIAERF